MKSRLRLKRDLVSQTVVLFHRVVLRLVQFSVWMQKTELVFICIPPKRKISTDKFLGVKEGEKKNTVRK